MSLVRRGVLHQNQLCVAKQLSSDLQAAVAAAATHRPQNRTASSQASSQQWQRRQQSDRFAKEARLQGYKSRAAFKLLEINQRHRIFKPGQTVIDLGFAPGSWSQVAVDRTSPGGRVIGIDIIPAQPPKGVSTIQGNFLSRSVQASVRRYVGDPQRGRRASSSLEITAVTQQNEANNYIATAHPISDTLYDLGSQEEQLSGARSHPKEDGEARSGCTSDATVDIVLSDMSAPWEQSFQSSSRSLINPYARMMNTSGNSLRDHVGSMELCNAALRFAFDTLKTGGAFVCKFYQGDDDKAFESRLKRLFSKVQREKPESSRSASREAYFVALKRKANVSISELWLKS